uniref:Putative E3 ubiquitin-protein ligase HERC1 n=1 Tax=Anthurium amnicola TaxID=1678845 RepID=A0A1D1YG27_9ARAE
MSTAGGPLDRRFEQAIVALKKGAHLLKCGRRGKPKFCPFRLSTDETTLIWYSGEAERQLKLNSVTKVILGQQTEKFLRQPQPGKECRSLSLVYQSGGRSLDLICKDKEQAETWFLTLKTIVFESHHFQTLATIRHTEGVHTAAVSPIDYTWRKHNGKFLEGPTKLAKVQSLCGSPAQSMLHRYASDGSSCSPRILYSSGERTLSDVSMMLDKMPHLPHVVYQSFKEGSKGIDFSKGHKMNRSVKNNSSIHASPLMPEDDSLKDVLMWGEGVEGGILGGGMDTHDSHHLGSNALLPRLLESTEMLDVQNIFCGRKYVALINKQGDVFTWGKEYSGRLGHKTNIDMSHPKLVESLIDVHVSAIACGANHACALTSSGDLYEWGDSCLGSAYKSDENKRSQWLPHRILEPLSGIHVSKVACGDWHTAVISSSGQLFTYGDGMFGVLGHGNLDNVSQPKEVVSLKGLRVKSLACGPWHTAAIVEITVGRPKGNTSFGKLFTWGDNDNGRLGHVDKEKKLLPTCVASLVDHDFVQVSCGMMLTVALTITGIVFTMGSSIHGQLGNPQAEGKSITAVEDALKGEYVKEISSGSFHVAVLTMKGEVYTWGKGANGRLGLGDTEDRNFPVLVEALKGRQVQCIACGSSFTAAICLHRSILGSDQSVCHGCKLVFGFTRKKHNCYNCGLSFCHSCTSKKALNASLAPNKHKLSRVCNPCFNQLKVHFSSRLECETSTPRLPRLFQKRFADLKIDRKETVLPQAKIFSPKLHSHEVSNIIEDVTLVSQFDNQQNPVSFKRFPSKTQRWGQVSCPLSFHALERNKPVKLFPLTKNESSKVSNVCFQENQLNSKSMTLHSTSSKVDLKDTDEFLIEELRQLRDEVRSLTRECQVKVEKLDTCKQRIKETLTVARDEAAKCKAAKDVIKALTAQMNALAEKFPAGGDMNSLGSILCDQFICTPRPISVHNKLPEPLKTVAVGNDVTVFKDRQLSDLPDHQNQASHLSLVMKKRVDNHGQTGSPDEPQLTESRVIHCVQSSSKNEWVEQDEPGVYITFMVLPSGQKGLKRVRFSRKRFSEKEAEKWWEENQTRVYKKYDIEQIVNSVTCKTNR